jgi:hypothetical protein
MEQNKKLNTDTQSCQTAVSGSVTASELRIGNWVMTDKLDSVEIIELRKNKCRIKQESGHIAFIDYERLFGDKLTYDWFLTFGYYLHPWGYAKENYPLIAFTFTDKDIYWIELGNGLRIDLTYVHTLQNIINLIDSSLTDR